MNAKEAVRVAKTHVMELFGDEGVMYLGLEEIEYDGDLDSWEITLGFSRPWDQDNDLPVALGRANPARSYKLVRISDKDGAVTSIATRQVAASE